MSAPARFPLLRLVLAIVALMLVAGSGLGGLICAFAPSTHVCTCSSGGSHAACPVCNPQLTGHPRSREPVADGAPCGGGRFTVAAVGEPGVVPMRCVDGVAPFVCAAPHRAEDILVNETSIEPTTPPPRITLI